MKNTAAEAGWNNYFALGDNSLAQNKKIDRGEAFSAFDALFCGSILRSRAVCEAQLYFYDGFGNLFPGLAVLLSGVYGKSRP